MSAMRKDAPNGGLTETLVFYLLEVIEETGRRLNASVSRYERTPRYREELEKDVFIVFNALRRRWGKYSSLPKVNKAKLQELFAASVNEFKIALVKKVSSAYAGRKSIGYLLLMKRIKREFRDLTQKGFQKAVAKAEEKEQFQESARYWLE